MILQIISGFAIILAAFFKAVADTCAHHYSTSVFRRKEQGFWDNSDAWYTSPAYKPAKRIFNYPVTAWHLANSGMIASFCLAFCLHERLTGYWFEPIASFILSGALFILVFNLFYDKILRL